MDKEEHVKGKGKVVARHEGIWVVSSKLYLRRRSPQYSLKISVCGPPITNLNALSIPSISSSLQSSQLYRLSKCIRLWPACFVAGRSRVTNIPKTRKSVAEVRVTQVLSNLRVCCVVTITLRVTQVLFSVYCVVVIYLRVTQVLLDITNCAHRSCIYSIKTIAFSAIC
jgi:hypothetical protein